jgi:hypothetical protein
MAATRAPFLKTRYGGYFHRNVPAEDTELTHVGPGTPCGEYLRRFWQPVCYSDDLKDLPLRVQILGEELVVFRDGSGTVGLLELHCPHRGTSLEFGLVGAKGTLHSPPSSLRSSSLNRERAGSKEEDMSLSRKERAILLKRLAEAP